MHLPPISTLDLSQKAEKRYLPSLEQQKCQSKVEMKEKQTILKPIVSVPGSPGASWQTTGGVSLLAHGTRGFIPSVCL